MTIYSLYPQDGKESEEPEIFIEEEADWQSKNWSRQDWTKRGQQRRPNWMRRVFSWTGIRLLILMGLVIAIGWMSICVILMAWRAIRYLIHWKRQEMRQRIQKAWGFFLMGTMGVVGGLLALWKIQLGVSWVAKRFIGGWGGKSGFKGGFTGSTISIHPLFYKIFARF
jgi:hypothetical protein